MIMVGKLKNTLMNYIHRRLFKPRWFFVLFGFFCALVSFNGIRVEFMKNTFLVNTKEFIPVYSTDTLPILSVEGTKIGFINPFFIIYLDSISSIRKPTKGYIFAWIWNESIKIDSGIATVLIDENIRIGRNSAKLGRINKNSQADMIYQHDNFQWSLVKINTDFIFGTHLDEIELKKFMHWNFRKPHLFSTDLSLYEVPEKSRFSNLFALTTEIVFGAINNLITMWIIMLSLLIWFFEKGKRLIFSLLSTYSYALGICLYLLINWCFNLLI